MLTTLKIKRILAGAAMLCSLHQGVLAASVQLDEVKTEFDEQKITIELWGEKLANGYADQLLVFFKNEQGQLLASHRPTLPGGYNCYLDVLQLREDEPQLLVAAGKGDWRAPSYFRILTFTEGRAKEIFSAQESRGLIEDASWLGQDLQVTLRDGKSNQLQLNKDLLGKLSMEKGQPNYQGLRSITAYDVDEDGRDELVTLQSIVSEGQLLADVGGVWKLEDNDEWQTGAYTIMLASPGQQNTINEGMDQDGYTVLPRKMLLGGGEATYPLIVCPERWELQEKINALIQAKTKDILDDFYKGQADTAFNVVLATDKMLSLQLISGKDSFLHRHVHLDMVEGREIQLGDIFDVKNPDFIALLNLLNGNKRMHFTKQLPEEWYIQGDKIFLLDFVGGREEVAGFALGNLHSFLLPQPWFHKNTD